MKLFGWGGDPLGNLLGPVFKNEIDGLEKRKSGAGHSAFAYITKGEPISALAEVAKLPNAASLFGIEGYLPKPNKGVSLYSVLDSVPSTVTLRFAKLLTAMANSVSGHAGGRWKFDLSQQAAWPEVFLMHASGRSMNTWGGDNKIDAALSMSYLEQMLVEDGLPQDAVIATAFLSDVKLNYGAATSLLDVSRMTGFADAVRRHAEALRPAFRAKAHEQRLHAMKMIENAPTESVALFVPELVACVTENSKQVRQAAQQLLRKLGDVPLDALRQSAETGDPAQRVNAIQAIWDLGKLHSLENVFEYVRGRKAVEKTRSVIETIEDLESRSAVVTAAPPIPVPDLPIIDVTVKLPATLRPVFDRAIEQINKTLASTIERAKKDKYLPKDLALLDSGQSERLWRYIAGHTDIVPTDKHGFDNYLIKHKALEELRRFFAAPGAEPIHIARTFRAVNSKGLVGYNDMLDQEFTGAINDYYHAHKRPTLLDLEVILAPFKVTAAAIARSYMGTPWSQRLGSDWDSADIWPFFARHLDIVRNWLQSGVNDSDYWFNRTAVFDAIATFPEPPAEFVDLMFDLALGSGKTNRLLAQQALDRFPNKEARIVAALSERKADTRTVAATWLGRLRYQAAVPALEAALAKESNDMAIGAIMSALELLGVSVDKFLNRDGLEKDAAKGLAKGIPAILEWFPWDALPDVHWADSGKQVQPEVVKWFVVQAAKLKSAEPHALLRRYATLFVPRDREALGQFVLDAWLHEDVRPIPRDQAEKQALASAQQDHAFMTSHPQYYKDSPHLGKTVEQLFAAYLPAHLRQPAGSAIDSKGVLAIASACCAGDAATSAARYLKEWYGTRASQGKTLIATLAWIEHPSATQLMLSVGNRFRTKSFQEEAIHQAELLAERKGWTLAELADRTIPSAGFDENCELELDYGERKFIAKLGEQFKVELKSPEGKTIASLPEPRKDEDETLAKDAKKAYSSAKKEIKNIVQMQTERLYEALCTQRTWRFEDWNLYLNKHAIMRRLLQGLIWTELREGQMVSTFRPLDDGTLTDVNDDEVTLDPAALVGVAHDTNLPAEIVSGWQAHLVDYKVAPLFQQFGKGSYVLPKDREDHKEITDFKGHLLETFALRGRATKLGYQRGSAEDGGWFYTYQKRFPTLGLAATMEFTGNGLPEENRVVALTNLSFARTGAGENMSASALPLKEIPKVLLSECFNDMRLIAAEGTGFDPDWEKKSEY